jgi:uncharacterized protein
MPNKSLGHRPIKWILDGYNIMFGSVGAPDPSDGESALRLARLRLLETIASQVPESVRESMWIIFDSREASGKMTTEQHYRSIRLTFSADYVSADELICQAIREHSSPRRLHVVSSDHQIQRVALARGAAHYDSEVWIDRILPAMQQEVDQDKTQDSHDSKPTDTKDSIAWLREFGFLDD